MSLVAVEITFSLFALKKREIKPMAFLQPDVTAPTSLPHGSSNGAAEVHALYIVASFLGLKLRSGLV